MNKANIIAPSFKYSTKELKNAFLNAKKIGFSLDCEKSTKTSFYVFAENPKERVISLNKVFRDDSSKVVFSIKGGYGSSELLSEIDYDSFKKNQKILLGFSDITALLNAIYKKTGCITYHASNIGSRKKLGAFEIKQIKKLINGDEIRYDISFKETQNFKKKKYSGKTVGGNLVLVCDLIGTEFEINCEDKLLFLECQNVKGYRIYTKLVQLLNAGYLQKCICVVLGNFKKCQFAEKYLRAFFMNYDVPVLWWSDFGHGEKNLPFPIGSEAVIDIENNNLIFKNN